MMAHSLLIRLNIDDVVIGDMSTFLILRGSAIKLAEANESLKAQIGHPYTLGPWYNARIGFSPNRNMSNCVFQLQGVNQITDINVRAIRPSIVTPEDHQSGDQKSPKGVSLIDRIYANTFIYNLLGSGEWRLVSCDAMFPAGGGLVKPQSLLMQHDASGDHNPTAAKSKTEPKG